MNASQKEQLFSNLAAAMQGVPERIVVRQLVHFYKADPDYGRGVAAKLGLDMKKYRCLGETAPERPVRENI